jgi:hypothetical protein
VAGVRARMSLVSLRELFCELSNLLKMRCKLEVSTIGSRTDFELAPGITEHATQDTIQKSATVTRCGIVLARKTSRPRHTAPWPSSY